MHLAYRICSGLLILAFGSVAAMLGFLPKSRYVKDQEPKMLQRILLRYGGLFFVLGGFFVLFVAP